MNRVHGPKSMFSLESCRVERAIQRFAWRGALCLLACSLLACQRNPPLQPYIAYVVNQQSATLAAVNLATFQVTATLPVSPQPERAVVRPGGQQIYVVSANGRISVVGFPVLSLAATVEVGNSAKDLAFSPDGRTAYLLNPADHEVAFLACQDDAGKPQEQAIPKLVSRLHLGGTLADLALSPDGKTLVVSAQDPDQVIFISTETRQALGMVEVGHSPGPLAILPDNSKVFVSDLGENKISVADIASRRLLSHIEIGAQPSTLLVKADGGEIFVLAAPSSSLIIMDAYHDNVEQTFPLGRNPVTGVFRRDMSVLYIANEGDGSVLALDVQNRAVLASTHVGMQPHAMALTPDQDQRLLVVADPAASSLAILHADPASLDSARSVLITTVTVGASPVDVVIPDLIGGSPTR